MRRRRVRRGEGADRRDGYLEAEVRELRAAVSSGHARGKFEPVSRDRKDWYD
jgi:hypothetical protein